MVPPSDDKGAAFKIAPTRHILGYKFALRDSKKLWISTTNKQKI